MRSSVGKAAAGVPRSPEFSRAAAAAASPGYAISDHGGSTDEEDEEENVESKGKHVPQWARGPALQAALQRQSQALVDPDSIFAEVSTCDLETIFKEKAQKGFRKRTSSANWSSDKVTVIEKRNYRKDMGFNSAANQ